MTKKARVVSSIIRCVVSRVFSVVSLMILRGDQDFSVESGDVVKLCVVCSISCFLWDVHLFEVVFSALLYSARTSIVRSFAFFREFDSPPNVYSDTHTTLYILALFNFMFVDLQTITGTSYQRATTTSSA